MTTCISPLATRPILYTDELRGTRVERDDLWAVTTDELNTLQAERDELRAKLEALDGFDKWQENPYTKVLQGSIARDYVPRTDLDRVQARLDALETQEHEAWLKTEDGMAHMTTSDHIA